MAEGRTCVDTLLFRGAHLPTEATCAILCHYDRASRRGNPPGPCSTEEERMVKRILRIIGIISIAFALLWFISGAMRMGFMVARSNIGLYEALFVALIGLVLLFISRKG